MYAQGLFHVYKSDVVSRSLLYFACALFIVLESFIPAPCSFILFVKFE